jgi:hypothetical protein
MTYKEVFKSYYATNPFAQPAKSIQLYAFVADLAETSAGVHLILSAMTAEGYTAAIHPDKLIELLRDLGWQEWPDLEKFLIAVDGSGFNAKKYLGKVDPPWPEGIEFEEIDVIHLHRDIRLTGFPVNPFKIDVDKDQKYNLVSESDLMKLMPAPRVSYLKYIIERRDCDDFSRAFLGWMSQKGYGNTAIFELTCALIYDTGKREYHSMLMSITKERQIWIWEPQNEEYAWKWGDQVDWPGVVGVEYSGIGE